MPELRHDPIQKRWVIIATERARRPSDFVNAEKNESNEEVGFCPFCEGNEERTPLEVFAIRSPESKANEPGWEIRVVPNKFPALGIEGGLDRRGVGIFDTMNGIGAHEVIIETPNHGLNLGDMPQGHIEQVIAAYRQRLCDLKQDPRFRYVLIFKNHGEVAGASLSHPHTQIIATPVTPRTVAEELDASKEHYHQKERCLFCDVIGQELHTGERIIFQNEHFIALTPFASRFPFEIFLAPREHAHDFSQISDDKISSMAHALGDVLRRLKISLQDPPYNFVLHTVPNTETGPTRPGYWATLPFDYHWHIEIMPRLTRVAGFEWGTGFYINPTPPEIAAEHLRQAGE